MIVEDDAWQAQHFQRQLEPAGFDVLLASDPIEAVNLIDNNHVDLIILDILLPGANGIAFLHELRSYHDTGSIPVILCSTVAGDMSAKKMEPYGVVSVINKSTIRPGEIVDEVRSALL